MMGSCDTTEMAERRAARPSDETSILYTMSGTHLGIYIYMYYLYYLYIYIYIYIYIFIYSAPAKMMGSCDTTEMAERSAERPSDETSIPEMITRPPSGTTCSGQMSGQMRGVSPPAGTSCAWLCRSTYRGTSRIRKRPPPRTFARSTGAGPCGRAQPRATTSPRQCAPQPSPARRSGSDKIHDTFDLTHRCARRSASDKIQI